MTAPSDRDKIIAKVAEAICNADDKFAWQWHELMPVSGVNEIKGHYLRLATAAFDALIEAWGPPW